MNSKRLMFFFFSFLVQNACGAFVQNPRGVPLHTLREQNAQNVFVSSDLLQKQFSVNGPVIEKDFEERARFNLSDGPLVVAKNNRFAVPRAGALCVVSFMDFEQNSCSLCPKAAFLSPQDTENSDEVSKAETTLGWKKNTIREQWEKKKKSSQKLIFGGLAATALFAGLTAKVPNDTAKIVSAGCAVIGSSLVYEGVKDLYQLRKFFRAPSVPQS